MKIVLPAPYSSKG